MGFPSQLAGLGVQGHQFGVQSTHEDVSAHDGYTTVVRSAAIGGDGTHFVFVMPELFASDRIDGVHMVVGGGQVHHAIDHDGRCFHGLQHFSLESESRTQVFDVACVDLLAGVIARLRIVHVGVQEVVSVLVSSCELRLGHGD